MTILELFYVYSIEEQGLWGGEKWLLRLRIGEKVAHFAGN